MDAIDLLTRDHRDVEDLFTRIKETDLPDVKEELFQQIAHALTLHAVIEEQHFYPAVRSGDTQGLLKTFMEDHDQVKRKLARLLDLETDDEDFDRQVDALRAEVESHVMQEETELFARVRAMVPPDGLRELGDQMAATKSALAELEPRDYVDTENVTQPL